MEEYEWMALGFSAVIGLFVLPHLILLLVVELINHCDDNR